MLSFLRKTYLYVLALPVLFIFLGAASNQAVLIANHGKFPVMVNAARAAASGLKPGDVIDGEHSVMAHDDKLKPLADIFDFHDGVYSVGDELIELGEWSWGFAPYLWGFAVVKKLNEKD